jgi:hypothetical protein
LTRTQRILVLSAAAILWLLTSEPMLFLIALAAVFRLFTRDASKETDRTGLLQFSAVMAALAVVVVLAQSIAK